MTALLDRLQQALGTAYRIERELGGGGMSHVFVAEETALGRRVVIKVLPPDLAAGVSADRFRREIQLAAQLQHPGIVPVLSAGAHDDLLWYVMPLVEGESLRARLARGPLPIDEAVRLWRDLLEALEYAHSRGIVHRDIKPENIMLTGRRAVTLDFGVAKAVSASTGVGMSTMTGVGLAIGTPAYMAPEQAAGDGSVDARADLYAAGLVMYEMLAGRGPFDARTPTEMMAAHIATAPTPIATRRTDVGASLASLLMTCLAKDPADRPASVTILVQKLDSVSTAAELAVIAAPSRGKALNTPRWIGVAAVLAALIVGIVFVRGRATADPMRTVAVVPILQAGADTTQADVADGVADDLAASLHHVSTLRVISRNSSQHFKARTIDTKAIRSALDADHVVELAVKPSSAGVKVTVDVVRTSDGVSVWTSAFDAPRDDAGRLGERVASAMATDLRLNVAASATPHHRPTPEAFEAYSREVFYIRRSGGKADFDSALASFHQAITADSLYAAPYVAAARMYDELPGAFTPSVQYDYAQSDSLIRRALVLDPENADALAMAAWNDAVIRWNWSGARRGFDDAIRRDGNSVPAHLYLGLLLGALGDLQGALREARTANHLEPYDPYAATISQFFWNALGQPDSALAIDRVQQRLNPDVVTPESNTSVAWRLKGRADSALAVDRHTSERLGSPTAGLVHSLALSGRRDEAERTYRQIADAAEHPHGFVLFELVAYAAVGAGNTDDALRWFERAMDVHSDFLLSARWMPEFKALRETSAFKAQLERMGLPRN